MKKSIDSYIDAIVEANEEYILEGGYTPAADYIINNSYNYLPKESNNAFHVFYEDSVNDSVEMFAAGTLDECKAWIEQETKGYDKFLSEDSEYLLSTSKTFCYEVYEGDRITMDEDGEAVFNDPVYTSPNFYAE